MTRCWLRQLHLFYAACRSRPRNSQLRIRHRRCAVRSMAPLARSRHQRLPRPFPAPPLPGHHAPSPACRIPAGAAGTALDGGDARGEWLALVRSEPGVGPRVPTTVIAPEPDGSLQPLRRLRSPSGLPPARWAGPSTARGVSSDLARGAGSPPLIPGSQAPLTPGHPLRRPHAFSRGCATPLPPARSATAHFDSTRAAGFTEGCAARRWPSSTRS